LTWKVRQLLLVRAGASAKDAGIRSDRLYRQARTETSGFGPGELAWVHDRLARLDLELKGGELDDDVAIEIAVLELATSREVGAPFNPLAIS
jgi:DNA polymerase III delta subunit